MDPAILFFFEKDPAVLALYEAFETAVNALVPDVGIKVRKTQITYTNPRVFAAVSFLPARRKALRPEHYITVTLGLNRRLGGGGRRLFRLEAVRSRLRTLRVWRRLCAQREATEGAGTKRDKFVHFSTCQRWDFLS